MRERDIDNFIEQQNPEAKQQIWEKVSAQLGLEDARPKHTVAAKPNRMKWALVALAVVCIVTLSVVLPLTLRADEGKGFCDSTQYRTTELNQTLKEYSLSRNHKLLYVDWYDIAEETKTVYGCNKNDSKDIFFFREEIVNGETGEKLTLSITDNKTRVDVLARFENANEKYDVAGIEVNWQRFNEVSFLAKFEYGGYVYYLQLDGSSQERLIEIVTDMLK